VPNEIIVTLLKETMERITRITGKNHFLLDGFPRSLDNLNACQEVFGSQMELPLMLYFECPLAELQRRILGRAPFSGRSDDNVESMKMRFETLKAETLPIVNHFKQQGKCREIDTSLNRQAVFEFVRQQLVEKSDPSVANRPLCERAEILLGLRPYPKVLSRKLGRLGLAKSTKL
jgi:UMP-CMP kinase